MLVGVTVAIDVLAALDHLRPNPGDRVASCLNSQFPVSHLTKTLAAIPKLISFPTKPEASISP